MLTCKSHRILAVLSRVEQPWLVSSVTLLWKMAPRPSGWEGRKAGWIAGGMLGVSTTERLLSFLPPQPSRWKAGPCLAARCCSCPAARPLCLLGSLPPWLSLWMESLVSEVQSCPLPVASRFLQCVMGLHCCGYLFLGWAGGGGEKALSPLFWELSVTP